MERLRPAKFWAADLSTQASRLAQPGTVAARSIDKESELTNALATQCMHIYSMARLNANVQQN
jgi:hypothetical protein